jgi:hypothetical protein
LLLDIGDNSGEGILLMWVAIIFCGRMWTITSDDKQLLVQLVDLKTVLRAKLMP